MAEFGPALGILLICIFLPLVDLLGICLSYGLCVLLNSNQVHEASMLPTDDAESETGPVKKGIPDQWSNGMGKFVKMSGTPTTVISYRDNGTPTTDSGSNKVVDKVVMVRTTITCNPFLPIPIPMVNVPGLNGPMTFMISSERPMENPDNAP